jgi:hypothetical protein
MQKWQLLVGSCVAIAALGIAGLRAADNAAADDAKPKFTTKQVMEKCMKGGLCKKVAEGKASEAEKAQLVEMISALAQNKPPKGEADSWKTKTAALGEAAKAAADGKEGAGAALMKAANCAACHKEHKPA